jgi:hypothetical protein
MSVEAILRPIVLTLRRAQLDINGRNDSVVVAACHIVELRIFALSRSFFSLVDVVFDVVLAGRERRTLAHDSDD